MIRGLDTAVRRIRRQVFEEVARFAYSYENGDFSEMEHIPYKIIPGEESRYRDSVFMERAIVAERLRLAMGLPFRNASEHGPVSEGAAACARPDLYYEPPLVNVIKFACHKCKDNEVRVTQVCQNCLAHSCQEVCPKNALDISHGKMHIDQSKCIQCKRCVNACSYSAIIVRERPCAKACGMKAIGSDEYGRAAINYDRCVSCGMCMVECPYGAIADKSQIFQLVQALRSDTPVVAIIAPAIVGQFGPKLTIGKLAQVFKILGFERVLEVAVGADACSVSEANDFLNEVPEKVPFMITSCCPAWRRMVKIDFPELKENISLTLTPMVITGRMVKRELPDAKVAFIGPCASKKLEAQREKIKSDVDFVLTFEELQGMIEAKGIDLNQISESEVEFDASADGWGFAKSGGVAESVVDVIKKIDPDRQVKVISAQGLSECKKLLQLAKTGKYNGYLLEGMGCPGGCIAGAGTLQPINKSAAGLDQLKKKLPLKYGYESDHLDLMTLIDERTDEFEDHIS